MEPITRFTGRILALPHENVDTDQIIPARFLKVTAKDGLAEGLFCDWRYDASGRPRPDFVLNQPQARGASILVAGDNFGCGSSREHAPWALVAFGFRAIVSTSFADIFRNNSLKNGLLPIVVDSETHRQLLKVAAENPAAEVTIDLASQSLELPNGSRATFPIDNFSKQCLLQGVDELGYILKHAPDVEVYESRVPPRVNTTA